MQRPDEVLSPAGAPAMSIDAASCGAKKHSLAAADAVRWREGVPAAGFPPIPLPSRRVFAEAGEGLVRGLVARHHERLMLSAVAHLFPSDPARFAAIQAASTAYFLEATGGAAGYSPGRPSTCMRSRHLPIGLDERAREIWLAELLLSFDDVGFPACARAELWDWVEAMSIRTVKHRSAPEGPARHPLEGAHASLRHAMQTRRRPVVCPR